MIDPEMFLHLGGCDEANQYKSTGVRRQNFSDTSTVLLRESFDSRLRLGRWTLRTLKTPDRGTLL